MEDMTEKELCDFCKSAIKTLMEEKKEEVMKCVGTFVHNEKIDEINKKISTFQNQCKHIDIDITGKCKYCGKQLKSIR